VLFITRGPHMAVVKCFYERSLAVFFANCALKHRVQPRCWMDRIARPVQNGNCYSRLAQRMRDTKLHITGTNNIATYILWEHWFFYTFYRTGTMIIPGTSLQCIFCSSVLYTTPSLYIVAGL